MNIIQTVNPFTKYLWLGVALALVLAEVAFGAFMYRAGGREKQHAWDESIKAADIEAFKISERRQSAVVVAQKRAATRTTRNRADAARAGDAVLGLRDAIAARKLAEESAAAAAVRADTYAELFLQSVSAYRDLAQACDGHVSDLKLLLEAWPQ